MRFTGIDIVGTVKKGGKLPKQKTEFLCTECGHVHPKWVGRCVSCGEWGVIQEVKSGPANSAAPKGVRQKPIQVSEISGRPSERRTTGIKELDRVLGGGVVQGGLILLGGDPGVGKSTLMLQTTALIANAGAKVLYVSGEESLHQTKMRFDRLNLPGDKLWMLAETSLELIETEVLNAKPELLVIDSIQTLFCADVASTAGAVNQLRQCTHRLMRLAKDHNISIFIVGHVTKEGAIAGPRMLEHMVDAVLYVEGQRGQSLRVLRAVKNRFGSTDEIGTFQMLAHGLVEVENPSAFFLSERSQQCSGSVVFASHEGSRPLLVEIQALVAHSGFGTPRRTAIGLDHHRLALLIAVLEKKSGLELAGCDVFLNLAGGLRIDEPATDLAVLATLVSSHLDRPITTDTFIFGEVGLSGEVRAVQSTRNRILEAAQIGMKRGIIPKTNEDLGDLPAEVQLIQVEHVNQLLDGLF